MSSETPTTIILIKLFRVIDAAEDYYWENNSLFPCERPGGCTESRAAFCYGNGSVGDDVKETPISSGSHHYGLICKIHSFICRAELTGNTVKHVITQEFGEVEGKAGGGLFSGLQLCCLNL